MSLMTFDKKLERLCELKGWTQAELARRAGLTKNMVNRWWNAEALPYEPRFVALCRALGVSADYLIDDRLDDPPRRLTADERAILAAARASQLGIDEAIDALWAAAKEKPEDPAARELNYSRVVTRIDEADLDEQIERAQRAPVKKVGQGKRPPEDSGGVPAGRAGGGTKGPTKGGKARGG